MAIGRKTVENLLKLTNPKWKTSITRVEPNKLVTRGYSQEDLIGKISFPEMVYLLVNGKLPSEIDSKMLEAVLVSFCDHGVTPPSTQVARLMASTGSSLKECVSGGLLSFGKFHAGAMERSMQMLQYLALNGVPGFRGPLKTSQDIKAVAEIVVDEYLSKNEKMPGYGHRYHSEDKRAFKLIRVAKELLCVGVHTQLALSIEEILYETKGIKMNIDGANAGILSDLGFDWKVGTGIFMMGRLPGIISHVFEEQTVETPFRKLIDTEEIHYSEKG
ncbi:MAG: citryl-CoA lyase [Methanobacterium sp.]|nr:citryl-CoA lyase [Methanobacterium sp.]